MATAPQPEPGPGESAPQYPPPPSGYAPPSEPAPTIPPPSEPVPGYPPHAYQPPQRTKPSAYWVLSVIALLFSLVFGIIGLIFSAQVNSRWDRGDAAGAKRASTTALVVDLIGIAIGVIAVIAVVSTGGSY